MITYNDENHKEDTMTLKEAKDKLKHIASGKFHSVRYELTEYVTGELAEKCTIYIDGEGFYHGKTWQEAFKNREIDLNLAPSETDKLIEEQMP